MFYSIYRPGRCDVMDVNGDKVVSVDLATDNRRVVSVVVELVPFILDDEEIWEFSFSIAVFAPDGGSEPFTTQDREIAKAYLPDELRPKVMLIVCDCLKELISQVKPPLVYMVTKGSNLPEKALRKHHLLIQTLENGGYSARDHGTDIPGRQFWTMQAI